MSVDVTRTNVTRNQSTATYTSSSLILFEPEYGPEVVYKNTTGASLDVKSGLLVVRDVSTSGQLKSATSANLADVVGVLLINDVKTLANNATVNAQYLIGGEIDAAQLILPDTVTLNTVVGNKFLRDILSDLDFKLQNIVEHSKL